MKAKELNTTNFDATITQSDKPVLVDFWAPWCGPCQVLGPIVDEVAGEQEGKALVTKVNIDDAPELAARYGVRSIPTLIVFKDGEPTTQLQGVQSKTVIEQSLAVA